MHPYPSLTGHVALVTSSSRGIGQMITQGLLEAGVRVLACARDAETCADTVTHLSVYDDCQTTPTNPSSETGARRLTQVPGELSTRLDILVSNIDTSWGAALESYPASGRERVVQLSVTPVLPCIQQLLPPLRRSVSAESPVRVINIGSVTSVGVMGEQAYVHGPNKAALHQLSRMSTKELVGEHVNVSAIAPGRFSSRVTRHITNDPQTLEVDNVSILMGRRDHPEEMAALAISLAGITGTYITGNVIPIDDGSCF